LFDRPDVIDDARPTLTERGVAERCEAVGGDFFVALPENADAYLMSHVLHDWDDDNGVTILRNCRAAITPGGRLLIVEMVLPPGGEPHPGQMLDMVMLVIAGGMERTEEQYGELLRRGGFRLTRVVPTRSAVSVIEAVPELDGP
jgi:hypothetical protein